MRLAVLGVLEQDSRHIGAGVLEQLVGMVEDDQSDLAVAQYAQLVSLLHQPKLSLRECHLENSNITVVMSKVFKCHLVRLEGKRAVAIDEIVVELCLYRVHIYS